MKDNSDYVEKERELTRERKFLRNIMTTIPDSLLVLDGELQIKSANHSFYKLFQTKPGMTIGRKIVDILGDEDGKLSAKLGGLFGAEDKIENFELHHQSEKLGDRILNITARGIIVAEEEEEEEEELLVVIHDVTDRKRAEEMLLRSEENFRHSLDDSPLGIRIVNDGGEALYANRAMLDIYGYDSIEELKTTPRKKSYTPESHAEHQVRKEKRQRGEYVPSNYEISIVRKDGEFRHLEVYRKEVLWNGKPQFQVLYNDITERKRAGEALRESQKRYKELADFLPQTVFELDETGNFIFANRYGFEDSGYTQQDIDKSLNVLQLFIPEDRNRVRGNIRRILAGERLSGIEYTAIRKDGSTFPVLAYSAPITRGGKTAGLRGLVVDITERKQAEEALRESEEKYRGLVGNVDVGICRVSTGDKGDIIEVNPAMSRILGYSREELLRMNVSETYQDPAERKKFANKVCAQGFVKNEELKLRQKDGTPIIVSTSGTAIRDEKGNIIYLDTVLEDITDRKRAEEALVDEATRWRILVEQSRDGIVILDQNGKVYEANQQFAKMLGYSPEETAQLHVWDWDTQWTHEQLLEMLGSVDAAGDHFETYHRRKDGTIYDVEISTNGAMYAGQKLVFCVCRDLTERKREEEERLGLERKAQINGRLASIGEMAAGIAHEINNPLTPILGFADLLLKRDIPEDIRADLQVIRDSAKRTADVTRRLLTFARQYKPMRTLCNINEVVETVLQLRDYHLKTNSIKVIIELAPGLPQTMADAGQLQQVMLNLIMNAEYEMSRVHGGGKLLIKTEKKDNIIRVLVKDDGLGISKENMRKLFHPFFTTKTVGEGTGLGLSVCHGIVTEHNGRIYAESKVGEGATFIVELPVVRQEEEEEEEEELSEPDTGEAGEAASARILVVDDEPVICQFLKRVLTGEGHEVETVASAGDALEKMKSTRYNLILLDIKLPGKSGIELYKHIKDTTPTWAKRIVFITGDVMETDTRSFLSRSKVPYITKPFDTEQLKKGIKSKLTKRG